MKIPFDIKYRPQIESGEYKVETRSGLPARIVCWDRNSKDMEILALVYDEHIDENNEELAEVALDGRMFPRGKDHDYDLFIITPEEEMTEFEKAVGLVFTDAQLIPRDKDGIANIHDINEFIKKKAAELLALAKKELQSEIDAEIEKAYKTQDDVVFRKGWVQDKADALRDLPRWKQIKDCDTTVRKPHIGTNMIGEKMLYIGNNCISISKIMKLPGFNS